MPRPRVMLQLVFGWLLLASAASACIWDADTLASEKAHSPKLADAILGKGALVPEPARLRARIAQLNAQRRADDPAWWNDLAGAHLRLGQPAEAVKLLEPVASRFPDDYGIHANLGTAYHLLGRYADAEREIARDLALNPDAHFGLEKYHLALLQYLVRDTEYQKTHLYVDEWSEAFFKVGVHVVRFQGYDTGLLEHDANNDHPAYRQQWNLAGALNFQEGVIYMASLNPREPACFVMLGVAAQRREVQDLNLAVAAYQKAIALGSPQEAYLKNLVAAIEHHIAGAKDSRAQGVNMAAKIAGVGFSALALAIWISRRKKNGCGISRS
jgi:tetratricopeptide (TPR) repeat protein